MNFQNHKVYVKKSIIHAMASLSEIVTKDSVKSRCWMFLHKPEEPKNFNERVKFITKE